MLMIYYLLQIVLALGQNMDVGRIRYTRQSEEFLRLKLISRRTITVKFDPIDKAFKRFKKKKIKWKIKINIL